MKKSRLAIILLLPLALTACGEQDPFSITGMGKFKSSKEGYHTILKAAKKHNTFKSIEAKLKSTHTYLDASNVTEIHSYIQDNYIYGTHRYYDVKNDVISHETKYDFYAEIDLENKTLFYAEDGKFFVDDELMYSKGSFTIEFTDKMYELIQSPIYHNGLGLSDNRFANALLDENMLNDKYDFYRLGNDFVALYEDEHLRIEPQDQFVYHNVEKRKIDKNQLTDYFHYVEQGTLDNKQSTLATMHARYNDLNNPMKFDYSKLPQMDEAALDKCVFYRNLKTADTLPEINK